MDTCRSYSPTVSTPPPASLPVLQKQTDTQQLMDPRWFSDQGQDEGGCPNAITSVLPQSAVSLPWLHLGVWDNGLGCLLALLIPV